MKFRNANYKEDTEKQTSAEDTEYANQKHPHLHINIGEIVGLLAGGILGFLIGTIFYDAALYTAFGMMIGFTLAFELTNHN